MGENVHTLVISSAKDSRAVRVTIDPSQVLDSFLGLSKTLSIETMLPGSKVIVAVVESLIDGLQVKLGDFLVRNQNIG